MRFLKSVLFHLCMGVVVFLFGRILPRKWIREDKFPFKSFRFEKNGEIYHKIGIMQWKTRLPDASVIISKLLSKCMPKFLPKFLPTKRLETQGKIPVLIKETCVAEATHSVAAALGFLPVLLWGGIGSWLSAVLFFVYNVPYVLMQRFNRPRLVRVNALLQCRQAGGEATKQVLEVS